jgi:hypothetical protein
MDKSGDACFVVFGGSLLNWPQNSTYAVRLLDSACRRSASVCKLTCRPKIGLIAQNIDLRGERQREIPPQGRLALEEGMFDIVMLILIVLAMLLPAAFPGCCRQIRP